MGSSSKITCAQCGTTNYGVIYKCLKCGAPLPDLEDRDLSSVDQPAPPSRFEADTLIDYPPTQGAYIEITAGPDTGNHYALSSGVTFGRSKNCDIVIDSPKVSREHAKVFQNEYLQWLLVDLESMNGTFLNNHRVVKPAVMYNGDEFQISDTRFKITIMKNYLEHTPKPDYDQSSTLPEKRGLEPLPPRKGCFSNIALAIFFIILVAACIWSVLYFGRDIISGSGILNL